MSLYGQLADQLQQQIASGVWQAGERIPSIRQSCKIHHLSPMTVLQAYQLLESRGLILARPQSGYYVKAAPSPLRASAQQQAHYTGSVDINDLVFEVLQASKSRELVPLGMSVADPTLFPHPQLGRALASCMRKLDPFSTVADLPPGNEALRRAIAQRYASDGLAVSPQEIIITTGAMEALSLSLQVLTEPGDWVVVESPTFYGALQAIERLKLNAVEIPVIPGVGIDLALLAEALAQRPIKACWLMGNVQHPLGHTMPDGHKQALMQLLSQHEVPLVEDDVYADLYFGRERPKPLKCWDVRGDSLLCSSFSKCLAPGFRVFAVCATPWPSASNRCGPPCCASFRMKCASAPPMAATSSGWNLTPVSTVVHCTPGRSPAAFHWRPARSSPVRGSTTTACASTAPIPGALSWKPPSPSWLNLFTSSSLPIWMPETTRPRDRGVIDNLVLQRCLAHCLPDDTIWHKFQTVV